MTIPKNLDVARLYHINSSHLRQVPPPPANGDERPFRFRTYPGSPRVVLPGRDFALAPPLGDVLRRRRSVRDFRLRPLDLALVGRLLHASFGVTGYRQVEGVWVSDRPSPSAGGLYPLEVYLTTRSVETLPDGLYHYDARAHELERRRSGLLPAEFARMIVGPDIVRNANLVIVISAIFQRTMWKYGARGYRYVWLDAGHLGQNLYLVATALGLGAVSIGGFFDEELNRMLDFPAGEEEAIYLLCIGHPESAT
jgi:SagB-type dehydrogenase family enzyme